MRSSRWFRGPLVAGVLVLGATLIAGGSAPRARRPSGVANEVRDLVHRLTTVRLAQAGGSSVPASAINNIRKGVGMVLGYGSHPSYVSLVCDGVDPGVDEACDGPPEAGIVGTVTAMVAAFPAMFATAGIATCDAAPASGVVHGTDPDGQPVAITFEAPTHRVPAPWANGGAGFEHRATFPIAFHIGQQSQMIRFAFEYDCGDHSAAYFAIRMPMDNAPGFYRDIAVFTGPVGNGQDGFEVYLSEHDPDSGHTRAAHAMRIQNDPQSQLFQFWGVTQQEVPVGDGSSGTVDAFSRAIIDGNYKTGQASVFYDAILARGTDDHGSADTAAIDALPGASDDGLGSADDFTLTASLSASSAVTGIAPGTAVEIRKQGCASFSQPTVAPASTALCEGMPLRAPEGAPGIDPNGTFSIAWALSAGTKLESLP